MPRALGVVGRFKGRLRNPIIVVMILLENIWLAAAVLGIRHFGILVVVVFTCTSAAALQLTGIPHPEGDRSPRASVEAIGKMALAFVLWVGLPYARVGYPHLSVWQPVVVPPLLSIWAATVVVCWTLRPFWIRAPYRVDEASTRVTDPLILGLGLFLVSGSLVVPLIAITLVLWTFVAAERPVVPSVWRHMRSAARAVLQGSPRRLAPPFPVTASVDIIARN